jgi:membrane-associated phospholipid phosphatase
MTSVESTNGILIAAQPKSASHGPLTAVMRFNCAMIAILGLLSLGALSLAHIVHYDRLGLVIVILPWFTPLTIVAWLCHWAAYPRLRDLMLCVIWSLLLFVISGPLVEITGRSSFPLVDSALAAIDAHLFQTRIIVQCVRAFPGLRRTSDLVYALFSPPLYIAPLLLPCLCGYPRAARRYVFAVAVAVLLTLALFAIWPAAGPWTVEGFQPSKEQAATQSYLQALKSAQPSQAGLKPAAIVSFPSFHTVLAVLSAIAFWQFGRGRWFVLAVSVAVCISTITTGWHYIIDVVGGIAVAFAAWEAAARLIRE